MLRREWDQNKSRIESRAVVKSDLVLNGGSIMSLSEEESSKIG